MQRISGKESVAMDCLKAIGVLSVLAAHTVEPQNSGGYETVVSVLWSCFGRLGVPAFFLLGGFFFEGETNYDAAFWKKKFRRIIVPWFVCSAITFLVNLAVSESSRLSLAAYAKWVLGSGTWYYYITMYVLFLAVFRWLRRSRAALVLLIGIQCLVLGLRMVRISTTIPGPFFTDYLNPLHWVGYFSGGVLIRQLRLDRRLQKSKVTPMIAAAIALGSLFVLCRWRIFTYFHLITCFFVLGSMVLLVKACYWLAECRVADGIRRIGAASYCIYLLHLQIVQPVISRIPMGAFRVTLAPVIGLAVMLLLVTVGCIVCRRLPFGKQVRQMVGLRP